MYTDGSGRPLAIIYHVERKTDYAHTQVKFHRENLLQIFKIFPILTIALPMFDYPKHTFLIVYYLHH